MCNDFAHLHVHTEYSLLDGMSRIPKLIERAKEMGQSAIAITDHGVMHGVIDFYYAAKEAGIKPIIGMEAYLAPNGRSMDDKTPSARASEHLLLIAKNAEGYRNLIAIATAAQLQGFYYKPRIDKEFLASHAKGLITTTGCMAAPVHQLLRDEDYQGAADEIGWYLDVFGRDNFFVELQDHGIEELRKNNLWLLKRAYKDNLRLVATNDVHYVLADDKQRHDTMLCIQTGSHKSMAMRFKMEDGSYHLTSYDEMLAKFPDHPDALKNTLLVAEMVELDLHHEGYYLPHYPDIPGGGYTAESYLEELVLEGAAWRYGEAKDTPEIRDRIAYELSVINKMGFANYFLIVWDLCAEARERGIWQNTRGSAAGSLVSYCIGITQVDPLDHHLLFERFLNPGRISMPDIDLDFEDARRGEMVEYARQKYGDDRVAAIITFGSMGAKNALRDVGRVYGVELQKVNTLSGHIPTEPKPKPLHEYVNASPELKKAYDTDDQIREVIDEAAALQGLHKSAGIHAAGVIIGDRPLREIVPLFRMNGKAHEGSNLTQATQFSMETCEKLGLLKVDFLGSKTLTAMQKACELINERHGFEYTLFNIPYEHGDDEEVNAYLDDAFRMIGRGETAGIFQIEGEGMRKMLMQMKPTDFEHITAAVALYRPGPMQFIDTYIKRMHGEEKVEYLHPDLEPILESTQGLIVFQEQIIQIASKLFGYEPGDADMIRKAVAKKKEKELAKHKERFATDGVKYGVDPNTAHKIWEQIEYFANYGFNRSHAAAYALITVQTAFLKCHFPHEYMTALLTVYHDLTDRLVLFMNDCRRMGIPILPPDINRSDFDFRIERQEDGTEAIRFGLCAIKGVEKAALQHIIEVRENGGVYKSLSDIINRVDMRKVKRGTLEALIKTGVMLEFGNRAQLLKLMPLIVGASKSIHANREVGQLPLFGMIQAATPVLDTMPDVPEVPQHEYLQWERELMGLYVSSRPVDAFRKVFVHEVTSAIAEILSDDFEVSASVRVGGQISELRTVLTKKDKQEMAIATIEDWRESGETITAVFFPKTWEKVRRDKLEVGRVLILKGRVSIGLNGGKQIVVDAVEQTYQPV